MKELSLRPYNGRVFYAATKDEYEKAHKRVLNDVFLFAADLEQGK